MSNLPPVILIQTIGAKLRTLASGASQNNPHYNSVMASPPTITTGSTLPGGQTNGRLRNAYPTFFQESGGTWTPLGTHYTNGFIWTTGGNLGQSNGSEGSWWRNRILAYANKVTFRLIGSSVNYRYIVNGQYVSIAGTTPSTSNNNADEYETLDFTSAGGLALREITVEGQQNNGFQGVYVGATENVFEASPPLVRSVSLGDSYVFGSQATALGDGIDAVMADYLGLGCHTNSGSGGTGWATGGSAYNFLQRVQNGDIALCGGVPDVIFLNGSVNDKNSTGSTITSNVLAALQSIRATYPKAVIIVFGVWPANVAQTGSLSVSANEAAVQAGVAAFVDPLTFFIPINGAVGGPLLTGLGWVGGTTGSGTADTWMFDNTHPNTAGANSMGVLKATAVRELVYPNLN